MTIYAIVNNFIGNESQPAHDVPVWTLISQAAILQGGNPYFVPDFAGIFEGRLALAIRVGKLGKGIAPRFASRYVDAVAPCMLMVARDMLEANMKSGLPWTPALSYDRSLVMGAFTKIPYDEISKCDIRLHLESETPVQDSLWNASDMVPAIDRIITTLSQDNTLKTGDIILAGIADQGPRLKPGLRATVQINGADSLCFNIR